jgi:hypothetical protein
MVVLVYSLKLMISQGSHPPMAELFRARKHGRLLPDLLVTHSIIYYMYVCIYIYIYLSFVCFISFIICIHLST